MDAKHCACQYPLLVFWQINLSICFIYTDKNLVFATNTLESAIQHALMKNLSLKNYLKKLFQKNKLKLRIHILRFISSKVHSGNVDKH